MKIRCWIPAIALLVAACDPISGVRTRANLTEKANLPCVDHTIRKIDGVGQVVHRVDRNESYQILPHRGKIISVINQWRYGPNQNAALQIADDGKERSYYNGMEKMGEPWPAAQLDAFMPLMKKVNEAIEENCGLPLRATSQVTRN